MTFEEARGLFPVLERVAYLNAGTFGPLAVPVAEAMRAGIERDLAEGRTGLPYLEATLALRAELRRAFAALVDVESEQVALTASTSEACAIVIRGVGLDAGDEIVTTTDEHFGLLGPLGASAAHVVVVEPDPDRILAAVTPRTKLIATSQVLWTTGAVLPLAEIRERSGVPVLSDGAQSVGAMPTSAAGVDFLTISGQKWLCGPDATGALVVHDPDALALPSPSYFAQTAYEPDGSFTAHENARRLETGLVVAGQSSRDARGARAPPRLVVRPRLGHRGALSWRAGAARRARYASGRLDARVVPPGGASRRASSSGSTRRTSTCGSSRGAASCGPRARGGRATRTSTAWWPPSPAERGRKVAAVAAGRCRARHVATFKPAKSRRDRFYVPTNSTPRSRTNAA